MMRVCTALVGLFAAACSFTGGGNAGDGDADAAVDADRAADAAPDAAPLGLCDPGVANLGACWEFENNFDDATGNGNDGTGVSSPNFAAGFEGDALDLDGQDEAVTVEESAFLDSSAITVEARIFARSLPSNGNEHVVFDNQSQYAMAIFDNGGEFRCSANGSGNIDSGPGVIDVDTWYHVACVVNDQRISLFVDGDEIGCADRTNPAVTTGNDGSAIGADQGAGGPQGGFFDGLIDNLRVFETTRTPEQICAAAGRTGCATLATCP